jgi:DNA-binding LytR/AlgR family response regulator
MRIALCDDEQMHSTILQRIIRQWSANQEEVIRTRVYESAEAFLTDFERGTKFDIAFLDIHMGGMSGVDLAKLIRQHDMNMLIVFVTNFRNYVFEGYEVSAFRFLIKPIKEKKVLETLCAAWEICKKRRVGYFNIVNEDATYKVAKSDIVFFETDNHYISVHTFDGVHRFRGKMNELDNEFSKPMFSKCNRGILVNVEHISSIHKTRVIMTNKEELSLSRIYWEEMNRCYMAVHVDPIVKSAAAQFKNRRNSADDAASE